MCEQACKTQAAYDALVAENAALRQDLSDARTGWESAAEAVREPADIDFEALAWAYQKLLAFGVGNASMDNALMLDRLDLMLQGAQP